VGDYTVEKFHTLAATFRNGTEHAAQKYPSENQENSCTLQGQAIA
jgi:hypothetical protein